MQSQIHNLKGEILDYSFHEADPKTHNLVIIGHGVTGNKDRPWALALAEALAEAGHHALRFSFSGNGASEGSFKDSTISKEVTDLAAVISAAEDAGHSRITYTGHSMGGAVGVLAAARDSRIQRLISLAGMVYTAKFANTEFSDVTPGEGNMWEDENCPLSTAFVDDMKAIDSVLPYASRITIPWLLVHGSTDDVVPIEESRNIFDHANEPKKLVELPGVDHVFSDGGLQPMIKSVIAWLADEGAA
ncbi:MAG: alpha/beta fold hydrolase [Verrucomicrobiota bacterium]